MPTPTAHPNLLIRQLQARPRLILAIALGVLVHQWLPASLSERETTRLLVAWNAGISLYLILAVAMIRRSTTEHMRQRARVEDEGRFVVLAGVILATAACVAAIFFELAGIRDLAMPLKSGRIALAVLTIVSAWAFIHLMFALHYAHDFYQDKSRGGNGGLQFPGEHEPDYGVFLYFAAVIGTSGQTADVAFASRPMRRLGLLHCVLAYAFNTTLLALTINIAAGLL